MVARAEKATQAGESGSGAKRLGDVATYVALVVLAVLWLAPLAWAVDTALKPESDTTAIPISWIPAGGFTLESFVQVITAGGLLRWFFNSALTSALITLGVVLLASLAAYGFSRVPFRGRGLVFVLVLAGIIVPGEMLILPLFTEMEAFGLINTYPGVILPQLAFPVAVFIFKQFFDGVPPELEEAAIVDGASRLRVYWQIWMPLSQPVIAAVAIFTFVTSWNNFLWPFIVVTGTDMMTVPVGLATVQSSFGVRYADIMASAVLGGLPLMIVFLIFQRQIVQGIAGTGLKG
ncbi:MAG: ABC transporter, permease protein 2 (cluster 1, maltose/g3p/polyamine/iron) [uncultured Rubrobacteraceae bacterium]|uniref:ABC transporter, permease protein 2 (Cluster 1, maltose/g3p/polyamine/iron) n=1 Tax=uncultured Rubrobacteraceae bacterium TaxID=349277 RepID=A0A6J4QR65_9ACTN|nr:MAG: ABC transporter, permease protein 2 (cluster 1, maltose/g3p/polyamine/iron) [uncultured Rubrobacteraceae bacterium]